MLEERAARGDPTPALDNRPELYEDLEWIWQGWQYLNQTRPSTDPPSPLDIRAIATWLELRGVKDPDERLEAMELLVAMDMAYMSYLAEMRPKPPPRPSGGKPRLK